MKKIICLALCLVMLSLALASCGNTSLPKGKASRIDFVDGGEFYTQREDSNSNIITVAEIEFEYVTESTVKVIYTDLRDDESRIYYIPTHNIEQIVVAE